MPILLLLVYILKTKRPRVYRFYHTINMTLIRVFDGVETSIEQLKDKWRKTLFFWKEEVTCSPLSEIIDFVDSLFLGSNQLLWDVVSASVLVMSFINISIHTFSSSANTPPQITNSIGEDFPKSTIMVG